MKIFTFVADKISRVNSSISRCAVFQEAPSPRSQLRLNMLLDNSKNGQISPRSATFVLTKVHRHRGHLKTGRLCCQLISNYCMRQMDAEMFVNMGAIKKVLRMMAQFPQDQLLTWLVCSSLWNLARPPATRHKIPVEVCRILWQILERNSGTKKVVQCALGALSNIAICERFQKQMTTVERLTLLDRIWKDFECEQCVVTAACGLVANLAIGDDSEDVLISQGVLRRLVHAARIFADKESIRRNCAAALSNLSHGPAFCQSMVECHGISTLFRILSKSQSGGPIATLITNALEVFDLAPENPVNCLHVAAASYDEVVLRKVLVNLNSQNLESNEMDICLELSKDNYGKTPLDYAIAARKPGNVFILASAGSPHTIMPEQFHMEMALNKGKKIFMETRAEFIIALAAAQPGVPMDICLDIIRQIPGPEIAFTT